MKVRSLFYSNKFVFLLSFNHLGRKRTNLFCQYISAKICSADKTLQRIKLISFNSIKFDFP